MGRKYNDEWGINMEIKIPKSFDLREVLEFTKLLEEFPLYSEYVYDYNNLRNLEPFGMLIVSSKLREFYRSKSESKHSVIGYDNNSYASHMGFYQSAQIDYGKKPGEAKGSRNYVPITHIDIMASYGDAMFNKGLSIEEYIEKEFADKLVGIVSTEGTELRETLTFCITEIIRNVYDHSKSKQLCFAGQYWPNRDLVEISILDEGSGIANTLKRNKNFVIESDKDALELSLKPGVTKSLNTKKSSDIYSNQGFGLFMTSKICEIAGDFSICSGDKCLLIKDGESNFNECSFNGTVIRLRLKPSKIKYVDLAKIRAEGNEIAKKIEKDSMVRVGAY